MSRHSLLRSAALLAAGLACGAALTASLSAYAEKGRTISLPAEDIRLFADVFGAIKS